METLRDMLVTGVREFGGQPALRYKQDGRWQTIAYRELQERACRTAALLDRLDIGPGERVAVLMANHVRWPEVYFGIAAGGRTAVPLDAHLEPDAIPPILEHAEATILFADRAHAKALLNAERLPPALKYLIVTDGAPPEALTGPEGLEQIDYTVAVASLSPAVITPETALRHPCRPEDTASIIYTSGTTGRPKGVMLTHANFLSNVNALAAIVPVDSTDNFLLVLPLHHAFAFTGNLLMPIARGACISLVESLRTVGDNIREVKPTIILGVPLLFEKLYTRIDSQLQANRVAQVLLAVGLKGLVRRRIRDKLGGHLRFCVVGGAPTDARLIDAFANLGIPLVEGYGLTETAPVLTLNPPDAPRAGSVGKPLPGVTVRIDAPDAAGNGELVVQSPGVMAGYFRNPEATAEVLREGWFRTGDLGAVDSDGYVHIAGRSKSLIVNREGKNIHPEEIEIHIQDSPLMLEVLVLGYRLPNEQTGERVGIIVVPDREAVEARLARDGAEATDAAIATLLQGEVKRLAAGLADYKRPRAIRVRMEPFEKTSTGKVRRFQYVIEPEG